MLTCLYDFDTTDDKGIYLIGNIEGKSVEINL